MSGMMIIFSEGNLWFSSGAAKTSDLSINPVGKSTKGVKKTRTRASAKEDVEIINPIFVRMAELSYDPFWKATFSEAAIGKLHRGFRFLNGILYHKIRNKETMCNINGINSEIAVEMIKTFMRTTAGIMSGTDIEVKNRELKQIMATSTDITIDSWGKIRSTQHRNILIANYVTLLAEHYGLSEEEESRLETLIRTGIVTKHFNSSTIHVTNSVISNIDGLYRLPDGRFTLDYSVTPEKGRTKTGEPCYTLETTPPEDDWIKPTYGVDSSKKWKKFVDMMLKRGEIKSFEQRLSGSVTQTDTTDHDPQPMDEPGYRTSLHL